MHGAAVVRAHAGEIVPTPTRYRCRRPERLDVRIERIATNPGGANRLGRNYTPSGVVGEVKVVSLHTDEEGRIPPR
jgi:hypothetical protein